MQAIAGLVVLQLHDATARYDLEICKYNSTSIMRDGSGCSEAHVLSESVSSAMAGVHARTARMQK